MTRLLFLLILLFPSGAIAQEVHRLAGYIQVPGAEPMSYYVQFTVKDTKVSGFSLTHYLEGGRLRASLVGSMSSATELLIDETGWLDSPVNSLATYCYFKAHLRLSQTAKGLNVWSGAFEAHTDKGKPCLSGYMSVADSAAPLPEYKSMAMTPKAPMPPRRAPVVPKPVITFLATPSTQIPAPAATTDSNACMRAYDWHSDSLSFDVWDGWTVDGDVISLSVNGHLLMDHIKLSDIKQHFVVPLSRSKNTMLLYLHEEGFDPPNTPNLILSDGKTQYELGVSGNSGEKVRICFDRLK